MIHNQSLFLKIASFCISVIKKLEPLSFRDQLGLKKKKLYENATKWSPIRL
jgi:hypothetical protein